ncbi:aldehyde dehydrogenase [Atractiella rhizophila]|nr:aldehyde dehydrogenase [Atractiella rhizophila]
MSIDLLSTSPLPCYVSRKAFHSPGNKTYAVHLPSSPAQKLHEVSSISLTDVPDILASSAAAAKKWRSTPVEERRKIFLKAADELERRADEFAAIEEGETTSDAGWAKFDVGLAKDQTREIAYAITSLRGEIITSPGQQAHLLWVPYGVIFAMAPWNAPLILGARAFTNALIGGNAVILKTSEFSPKTHLCLAQAFHDAGLPEGVLNVVHIAPEDAPKIVERFISDPIISKVNFTGSTRVGRIVAQTCGKYLKPCTLELGGKAPVIVLPSADLKLCASALAFGSFFHSGQICMSSDLILIPSPSFSSSSTSTQTVDLKTFKQSLLDELKQAMNRMPEPKGLFTDVSAERIDTVVKEALGNGAKTLAGEWTREGNKTGRVVLGDVGKDMRVFSEENFAPVVAFVEYSSIEEAIELANNSEYGLSSSIYGAPHEAYPLAEKIDAGAVHINGSTIHDKATVPHGGFKASGWGKFNSLEGIKEFSRLKVVTINDPHPYV